MARRGMLRGTGLMLAYLVAFLSAVAAIAMFVIGILNATSKDPKDRKGAGTWLTFTLGAVSLLAVGVSIWVTRIA